MQEDINAKEIGQTLKTNGKWVSKESKQAAKQAEGLLDQASEMAMDTYHKVVDRGSDLVSDFNTTSTKFVRQYPLQTAVGALAVGFILGSIAFRRASK